ncbi:hypothetical protein GCM10027429_11230 [Marivirga atlantica]|jgi:hypothetical protein|uniref:histidine kinase n=1 Tax=Marivirga atlantica TaxID=1548457 RepID=A0A937DJ13_9BACT|nr:GAF domain-containing protein [Marivirga atlantica]MBL0764736.1 GAF domain-containing protein [Marivirga atlantica]
MNSRLEEVNSYELFDTASEKDLDDITELASIICGTPISLITILDEKRQWFKSNKGLTVNETKVEDSFCKHTLHKPNEVLVVNDALKDERFADNKLVLDDPNIRFYAGAPLVSKNNHVLGTLCIIDRKPREITEDQKRALQILAKKAIDRIEARKVIKNLNRSLDFNSSRLVKLTENLPVGLFEMIVSESGAFKFTYLSQGMKKLHPTVNLEEWLKDATIGFSLMHTDDVEDLRNAVLESANKGTPLYHEYRVKHEAAYKWHAVSGSPSKNEHGESILHGSFIDVSQHYEHSSALEQICFDISHVLRRPVTSMLGLMNLIENDRDLSEDKFRNYLSYMREITNQMEEFTRNLNKIYTKKKQRQKMNNPNG